jgi:hypothetical protein
MKENRAILTLASMGMELSWRYAWAAFLTSSILDHPFPFPEAVGTFVLAVLITFISAERGWRVIWVLGLQLLGFIPAALRVIHIFNSWSESFLNQAFKSYVGSLNQQGIPQEWLIVLLLLFWVFFFWGGGVSLAKRPRDYATVCTRFDLGLGTFFLLFLIKFYLQIIGTNKLPDPVSVYLLFSFFIFGLLAVGLALHGGTETSETKTFMPGYRGLGVILSFIVLLLLFGGGLLLFAMPFLTATAKAGYGILKSGSAPLLYILMKVIHFIFGDDYELAKTEPPATKQMAKGHSLDLHGKWLQIMGEILVWLFWILLAIILLTIICALLYSLFKWLFSKTETRGKKDIPWNLILHWGRKLRLFLSASCKAIIRKCKGYRGVVQLYEALLGWGHRSGLPHALSETPAEYGMRLKYFFPSLKQEIEFIVEAFNREVYGEIALDEQQLTLASHAFRRLCSPLTWLLRLKILMRPTTHRE